MAMARAPLERRALALPRAARACASTRSNNSKKDPARQSSRRRRISTGVLLHGAAWHLAPLAPDLDETIGPAKRALTGCYLAFLCTFLMACFEAMPTSKAGINA